MSNKRRSPLALCINSVNGGGMKEKPIDWRGSSLRNIKDDEIFTPNAHREAGHQLGHVQAGLDRIIGSSLMT